MRDDQYINAVLAKCEVLKETGLWSSEPKIRPAAWLENFELSERVVAAVLLDHFIYFSADAVDQMLVSGYRTLRDVLVQRYGKTEAGNVLRRAVYTAVEGETPNVTDSGKLFCRKLRQILDIDEERFLEPRIALQRLVSGSPVIFLDDFVGSGHQFLTTWKRHYSPHPPQSFAEAFHNAPIAPMYLNLVASEYGASEIQKKAPQALLVANHVFGDEYSVRTLPRNRLLPDRPDLRGSIDELLDKYHSPLRLPTYFSSFEVRKYGFHKLGFLIAFEHSTPDATVPLLWAEGPGSWTPLVRRT